MTISVHTNFASLVTQNTLSQTNNALSTSMERLSTGYRINSAADDAAGLQIANRLETQTRGMNVAMRNAQDGISMMQTAEGAMDEVTNIAMRMNDLALQANNGSNSSADQDALQAEYKALGEEMVAIMDKTSFGGQNLFGDGTNSNVGTNIVGAGFGGEAVTFQIGATKGETLSVDVTTAMAALFTSINNAASGDLSSDASAAIGLLSGDSGLINALGASRAKFGANINRLEHTVVNLQNMTENTEAAKGRIMDTDYASEGANMSKQQMLMQSGSSILSATKMVPQLAMGMLG